MKRWIEVVLIAALLPIALSAQQEAKPEPNPVSSTVRRILERESKNLIAAAEEMPAGKYGFHPTPAQMTFGHLVLHIAGSNNFLCAQISGTPAPAAPKLSDADPKDKLIEAMKSSFDFCATVLAKVDDSQLAVPVKFFGGQEAPRAATMIALTDDLADHYATAAMYLRLNGLLPPTAQHRNK